MKLLVCHGYGMSSEIFKEMCGSLTNGIGAHHEYVFVDGEVKVNRSCKPHPEQSRSSAMNDPD